MSEDTLQKISLVLADIVAPLDSILQDPKEFKGFIEQIGWQLPPGVDNFGMAAVNAGNIIDAIISIVNASPAEQADSDIMMGRYLALLEQVVIFLNNIKDTIGAINTLAGVSEEYLIKTQIVDLLLVRIFDYLIIKYVQGHSYQTFTTLQFLGVFEIQEFSEDATIFQSQHRRHVIYYDRVVSCLSDPGSVMSNAYGWGSATPDINKLLINLAMIIQGFGANVAKGKLRRKQEEQLLERAVPESDSDPMPAIDISLISGLGIEPLDVGLRTFGLRATTPTATDTGLGLIPYVKGSPEVVFPIFAGWSVEIKGSLEADSGIALLLRPDTGLDVKVDLLEEGLGSVVSEAELLLSFVYGRDDEPLNLFKIDGVGGLSIEKFKLGAGVGLVDGNDFDIIVNGELTGGRFQIGSEKGDGFIAKILPEDGISALFDLGFNWSRKQGLVMRGSGGLEVQIPTHISLGPIEVQNLLVAIKIASEGIPIELGANIGANLGPLQVVVENIGAKLNFSFSNTQSGNLGPLDLKPGFKPPSGVGLAINAAVVKGGGFLRFDPDKEEYDGILELDLNGIVAVKAIGLITTKMPDGSKGFSLLLILTAEFGSPIQLGLGFTLSGVGGLLGLNRTMRLEVIATGIRDGGINSIMFPQNVIANAPRIISDLKKYFPVEEGTFLIGPMVKIGWGSPSLVSVSLGVIIEIPGNFAILGVLKVALPDEDNALIIIQVNFMGAIEFDKKRLWFFATIFDSRVLFITLEGQIGLLVGWGDDASFVVSVGGFHPAFNPPALPFGGIARIAISILNTDFARIRVEAYFAVTSNSVQFGAKVEIYFGVSAFNIDGHLAFDALFRFSPFYFIISISASLSVKVFGIGLFSVRMRGSLEGPTPWKVEGTGSISLLFFDIDVDFSHTWGNEAETTLPPISVMPLLMDEFQKLENWQAVLPANNQLLVTLRSFEQGATDLILHPIGSLKISQRSVPLGMTLDKVGNQKPADANKFDVTVSTTGIDEKGKIEESFAVGQYFAKSDSALLNAKSFEPMKGGVELAVAGEQYRAPTAVKRVVRYEKIIIDTQFRRLISSFFAWSGSLFSLFLNGNVVSQSVLSHKQQKNLKPFADKVEVGKIFYTVAINKNNTAFSEDAMDFSSQVQAQEFMNQQVAGDANLKTQLHVIPKVEMQRAA